MIICIVYPQTYTIIISYCLIGWIYNLGITAKNNRHLLLSLHVYQEFNSSNVRIYKSVLEALFPRHFVAVEHRQLHLLPLCTSGNSIQVSRSFEFCLKFAWNTGSGQKCRRNDGKKGKIETLWTQPLPFFPSLGNFAPPTKAIGVGNLASQAQEERLPITAAQSHLRLWHLGNNVSCVVKWVDVLYFSLSRCISLWTSSLLFSFRSFSSPDWFKYTPITWQSTNITAQGLINQECEKFEVCCFATWRCQVLIKYS